MPSNHISNEPYHKWLKEEAVRKKAEADNADVVINWEEEYKELHLNLIEMRIRCSSYRSGVENALKWLQEEEAENIHPATNITHLAEAATWNKIKTKKHNKENGN